MLKRDVTPNKFWVWTGLVFVVVLTIMFPAPALLAIVGAFGTVVAVQSALRLTAAVTAQKTDPEPPVVARYEPLVSIQIACCSEPADVVNATLSRIHELSYKNYEVLLIHNNNRDEANWRAIESHMKSLGPKFHFHHIDKIGGFKAGALNYVRQFMSPQAEICAIVDSDYLVDPNFLTDTVGHFADPSVAIVQTPQDYTDVTKRNIGLALEYRSHFTIIMNQAQADDAVTFTGTMGLIRASLFEKDLHWNEWCITEDTEVGIYIHTLGYRGVYIDRGFGRGYLPLDYASLRKQRKRWAYGNMQILAKNYWPILRSRRFTVRQKLSLLTQTVAWLHFELAGAVLYAFATTIALLRPGQVPSLVFAVLIGVLVGLVLANLLYFWLGLRQLVRHGRFDRLRAFLAHYGLIFVMNTAWFRFFVGKPLGFQVTNKDKRRKEESTRPHYAEARLSGLLVLVLAVRLAVFSNVAWYEAYAVLGFCILQLWSIVYLSRQFGYAGLPGSQIFLSLHNKRED